MISGGSKMRFFFLNERMIEFWLVHVHRTEHTIKCLSWPQINWSMGTLFLWTTSGSTCVASGAELWSSEFLVIFRIRFQFQDLENMHFDSNVLIWLIFFLDNVKDDHRHAQLVLTNYSFWVHRLIIMHGNTLNNDPEVRIVKFVN